MHKSSSSSAKHNPWKGVIGPALRGQRNAAAELFRTDTEDGIFDISAFLSHAEHLLDRAAMNWFAEATGTESVEDRAFTLDTLLLDSVQKLKPFYETVAEVNASTEDAIARQVRKGLTLRIQAWKSNAFKRVLKEEIATQSKYVTPRKRASQEHAARLSNAERLDAGVPSLVKDHPQAHAGAPTAFELQDPCSVSVGDKRYSLTPLAGEIVKVLNDDLQQNKSGVSSQILRKKTTCGKVWDAFRRRDGRRFWEEYIEKPEKDVFRLRVPSSRLANEETPPKSTRRS